MSQPLAAVEVNPHRFAAPRWLWRVRWLRVGKMFGELGVEPHHVAYEGVLAIDEREQLREAVRVHTDAGCGCVLLDHGSPPSRPWQA